MVLKKDAPGLKHYLLKQTVKIAVLGGGSWGTALAKIISENKRTLHWYIRKQADCDYIQRHHHNPRYLSAASLRTKRMHLSADINAVVAAADIIILAIPSAFLKEELDRINCDLSKKIIFSAVKGVIPESMLIVGAHLHEHHKIPMDQIGVITGPCHAEEVALERLSYLTIACMDRTIALTMAALLKSTYIRTKISNDIIGTEYAAMLKNIYAIAAGMAHGLGYGDNFQSVLMSNAIREMKRFIKDVYKMKRNINNSAYLGDLLVTGYSTFSRNRTLGAMVGKGYTVQAALLEMNMVAEGYYATKSAVIINKKYKTRTPIINAMYSILYEGKSASRVFSKLTNKLN